MLGKTKALVIDDDSDVLSATKLLLEKQGFVVLTAAGPEEGLRQLEQEKPDVVVLDVMMPTGIEGFQWVWNVRRHENASVREVPIVVTSAIHQTTSLRFHEGDEDESGSYLPVQAFLDKPVDPDQLVKKIEAVLAIPES